MTEPTTVGAIIAYLRLNRDDWTRGVRETEADVRRLAGLNPDIQFRARLDDWRRGVREIDEGARRVGRLNPDIRIRTNAASTIANLKAVQAATTGVGDSAGKADKPVIGLAGALALLGPAAIPVASVAGGALAGLLPTLSAVAFGIAGISEEYKSGALAGTRYGRDIDSLKGELSDLKAVAAGGLLPGLDQGLAQSRPLFREINTDAHVMSTQLGAIAAHAGPALLEVLTQLNPLFVAFGNLLVRGATELEHWAQSSDGVAKFTGYVQAELPQVLQLFGNLAVLFGHVTQGAAGVGGAAVSGLNVLVRVLDAIPVGVLQVLIPLLYSARLAMLGYRGISAIVSGIGGAYRSVGDAVQAFRDRNNIASLQVQAATARTSATVAAETQVQALAQLRAAEQAQLAAEQQLAAAEEVSGANLAEARAVVAAKTQEAATVRAAASVAVGAAARQAEAADASAARVVAAGRVAGAGWTAALGPIGALVLGLGFLGTAFLGSSSGATAAKAANDAFAESVKQSTIATNAANIAAANKQLKDDGSLSNLHSLIEGNHNLGLSYGDLTKAVTGSASEYDAVYSKLGRIASIGSPSKETREAAIDLQVNLKQLRGTLAANIEEQKLYDQAMAESQRQADGGSAAVRAQARAIGLTGPAYLSAQIAARQSTQSTREQTAAFQLESNAAGLLQQALDRLHGNNLSVAQAQTSLNQAIRSASESFKTNGTAIDGMSTAALANQQALEGVASQAQNTAGVIAKQTGSNDQAVASYKASKTALEDNLRAHNELTPAVQAYINKLYDVKNISDYLTSHPTKVDVDDREAAANIASFKAAVASIPRSKGVKVTVDLSSAIASIDTFIHTPTTKYVQVQTIGAGRAPSGGRALFASGGTVGGSGDQDTEPAMLTPGEEVTPKRQATKYRALLKAIAADRVVGYAKGGTVGGTSKVAGPSDVADFNEAVAALLNAARHSSSTAADVRDAAHSLTDAAHAAHVSSTALAAVSTVQKRLADAAEERAQVAARLEAARRRLSNAEHQVADERSTVAGAVTGGFDVSTAGVYQTVDNGSSSTRRGRNGETFTTTTPGTGQSYNHVSAASVINADAADVARDLRFAVALHRLVAEGLNTDDVAELAAKGPDALPTALALAKSTPAQIRKLNSLDATRKRVAGNLGSFIGNDLYGAGVDSARKLVNGLTSQEQHITSHVELLGVELAAKLRRAIAGEDIGHKAAAGLVKGLLADRKLVSGAAETLAEDLLSALRKKLRIHSPSLVMHDLGRDVVQGFANGMVERLPAVHSAAGQLSAGATPSVGASARAVAAGGINMPITVHAAPGQSERAIGRAAGDEIAWALSR